MRLFVALNLPEEERARIYKAAEPLREAGLPLRWLCEDTLHLTLKFLGDVRPETMSIVEAAVQRVARNTGSFTLKIGGFGAFPTIRRPRVLWVGVDPTPALRCLKQDVEWALTELGFERETRAFHPHVTIGRCDADDGAGVFRGLDTLAASLKYRGKLEVAKLDLMRSHLSRDGARYTVLQSSEMKAPASRK